MSESKQGSGLGLLAGIAALAIGAYFFISGSGKVQGSGGGVFESLGGSADVDSLVSGSAAAVPVAPYVDVNQAVGADAVSIFTSNLSGAQFATANTVFSLHGDRIQANRQTGANPFASVQLGFVNPESMNVGYGARTDVTDIAATMGSLPVDYSGAGIGTYWYTDPSGKTSVQLRDGRAYQSAFAEAYKSVSGNSAYGAFDSAQKANIAANLAQKSAQTNTAVSSLISADVSARQSAVSAQAVARSSGSSGSSGSSALSGFTVSSSGSVSRSYASSSGSSSGVKATSGGGKTSSSTSVTKAGSAASNNIGRRH